MERWHVVFGAEAIIQAKSHIVSRVVRFPTVLADVHRAAEACPIASAAAAIFDAYIDAVDLASR